MNARVSTTPLPANCKQAMGARSQEKECQAAELAELDALTKAKDKEVVSKQAEHKKLTGRASTAASRYSSKTRTDVLPFHLRK